MPTQTAPVDQAPAKPMAQAENAPAPTADGQKMPMPAEAAQGVPAVEINIEAPELPRVPYTQDQDPSLPAGI